MSIKAFNLKDIKTTKNKFDSKEKKEYVTEGAYECAITGLRTSDDVENYSGSPYISFDVKTADEKIGACRFWVIKETDAIKTQEWKAKSLKDFLVNAGVTNFASDTDAFQEAIGKSINVVFTYEEYITKNRETDEPRIGKMIRYRWSSKAGSKIKYNPDYNKPLSEEDKLQYNKLMDEYNSSQSEDKDDLPF